MSHPEMKERAVDLVLDQLISVASEEGKTLDEVVKSWMLSEHSSGAIPQGVQSAAKDGIQS